ncbi:MAG: nucleoside hydrolase [Erysipelotrichaceae bacterium]|nr:nucleoside hydrolase [Erysipelotrichaceae bacterium]
MEKKKVIFDCDIGCDDAVALAALLMSDNVDVIAVTTVFGNRPVDNTTDNALRLLSFMYRDIPVYRGCNTPMVRTLTRGRDLNTRMERIRMVIDGKEITIHEATLPLPESTRREEDRHACSYLIETLMNSEEKLDVCATGPLTNIAMALRLEPRIAEKIGTLYIMGGGLYIGNRTPVAEANFYDDPEAAEIVLTSGIEIVLAPIEGCHSGATYSQQDIDEIDSVGTPLAHFLAEELRNFIKRCQILFAPDENSCCIYDYAAVIPLIAPDAVRDIRREICRVDFYGGMADGQLVVDRRGFDSDHSSVQIIYELDSEKVHENLLSMLKRNR